MSSQDSEAIWKAYGDVIFTLDGDEGAKDASGNTITLDQTKIDEARATIDAEYAALEYSRNRASEYPSIEDQLDDIYHNGIDAWKATIKTTKDKYPKP